VPLFLNIMGIVQGLLFILCMFSSGWQVGRRSPLLLLLRCADTPLRGWLRARPHAMLHAAPGGHPAALCVHPQFTELKSNPLVGFTSEVLQKYG
jgi:hypothetical protein